MGVPISGILLQSSVRGPQLCSIHLPGGEEGPPSLQGTRMGALPQHAGPPKGRGTPPRGSCPGAGPGL